jgi:hypothetical protein
LLARATHTNAEWGGDSKKGKCFNINTEDETEKAFEDKCEAPRPEAPAAGESKEAEEIRAAGLGNDIAQTQTATSLEPAMPAAPKCKGKDKDGNDCMPEANPVAGDPEGVGPGEVAKDKWDATVPEIQGGVLKPLKGTMEHLVSLGNALKAKYEDLQAKHRTNQAELGGVNEMLQEEAESSYGKSYTFLSSFSADAATTVVPKLTLSPSFFFFQRNVSSQLTSLRTNSCSTKKLLRTQITHGRCTKRLHQISSRKSIT